MCGGVAVPVVGPGQGGERVRGADGLSGLGPLGGLQWVGGFRTGRYGVPRRVLSLAEGIRLQMSGHTNALSNKPRVLDQAGGGEPLLSGS